MNEDEFYVDQSLINDFFAEYEEAQDEINFAIDSIVNSVDKGQVSHFLDNIYRRIHSIKSNFRMIGEKQQSDTIHYLENIYNLVKSNADMDIVPVLYLVKVVIEELRFHSVNKLQQLAGSESLVQLQDDLEVLSGLPELDLPKNLIGFLTKLELQGDYEANFSLDFLNEQEQQTEKIEEAFVKVDFQDEINHIISNNDDLVFFRELIEQLEGFLPFWQNRSKKILQLLFAMNRARQCRVNEEQLIAAVFMHDIGMGFIAPFITHKPYSLDPDEEIIMQDHVHHGTEFLRRIPGWDEAAEMVAAHHENIDGRGYPLGLAGNQICDGAKLLAIGDAFWAMTNDRMYVYKKKPVINALMDINKNSGVIYDEEWVVVFNDILKKS